MKKNILFLFLALAFVKYMNSQNTGPGGVGVTDGSDLYLWVKADGLANGSLSVWEDFSGNSTDLSQLSTDAQPTVVENTWNGFPVVNFDGSQDFIFASVSGMTTTPEYSIITIWEDLDATPNSFDSMFASATGPPSPTGAFQIGYGNDNSPDDGVLDDFAVRGGGNQDIDNQTNSYVDIRQKNILFVSRTGDATASAPDEVVKTYLSENTTTTATVSVDNARNFQEFKLGANRGNGAKIQMNMAEFVIFKNELNEAQRIIVSNYLASKYDLTLGGNNVYTGGSLGFYYDVAGVGQSASGDQHLSAQGTGIVSVTLAGGGSLDNNEYLMWGHDNEDLSTATTLSYTPEFGNTTTIVNQLDRNWFMSENNAAVTPSAIDLGTGTVTFDLSELSHSVTTSSIRLLVDNDATFGLGTTSYTGTITGDVATFTGVDFNDGYYFSLGSISASETIGIVSGTGMGGYQGPGGVGSSDGSDMSLWVRADLSSSITTATGVSQWSDLSGNTNHLSQATGDNQPTVANSVMNGLPVMRFDGESSSHSLTNDITDVTDESYTIMYIWEYTRAGSPITSESLFSSSDDSNTTDSFQNGFGGTSPTSRWQLPSHQMIQEADYSSATIGIDAPNIIEYTRQDDETSTSYSNNTQTLNKTLTGTVNSAFTHLRLGINRNGNLPIDADLAEFMIFSNNINSLERTLISNYLSAKYNINLNESDIYDGDDDGFDFDVAGVGNDGADTHLDSRGTGIVRINTLSDLGTDEYLIWGANVNNVTNHTFSRVSTGGETDFSRLNTQWKVSECSASGTSVDVGSFDISIDLSTIDFGSLDIENCLDLKLVVDQDDADAVFNTVSQTIDLTINNGFATATITGAQITDNDICTLQYQDAIVRELDGMTPVWRNSNNGDAAPSTTDECYSLIIKDAQQLELGSNFNVFSLDVEDGSVLSITSGAQVTVQNSINLNTSGEFKLLGDAQLIQVDDSNNTNSGTNFYNTITPPTKTKYIYSYFGSPVDDGTGEYTVAGVLKDGRINPLSTSTTGDNLTFTTGITDGEQAVSNTTIAEDWIFTYVNGGIVTADDGEVIENGFDLKKSNGTIKVSEGFTMKYPGSDSQPLIFKGRPNSGPYVTTLDRNITSLVSNPYPSAIDANTFIADNSSATTGVLYFLDQQGAIDHEVGRYELGYATYTTNLGVTASASEDGLTAGLGSGHTYKQPDRYIPVGQGFYVESDNNGGDLVFNNGQRAFKVLGEDASTDNDSSDDGVDGSIFFKTNNLKTISKENEVSNLHIGFEFQLTDDTVYHRNLAIGFNENNTLKGRDFGYDATLFDLKPSDAYFGVQTENLNEDDTIEFKDEKFVILGVEKVNDELEVPLSVELDKDREVYFMIDNTNNVNRTVYLKDKLAGTQEVLTGNVISKNLTSGSYTDRFYITFKSDETLSNDYVTFKDFTITNVENILTVTSEKHNILGVELYSITGNKIIKGIKNINISNIQKGVYIVKVLTPKGHINIKNVL